MRALFAIFLVMGSASAASAKNVVCHPGMPSVTWDGRAWQFPGYSGSLTEVTIGSNFGVEQVTCKRNSFEATTVVNGKCHFKAGSDVSVRKYLKMEWRVCETHKAENIEECVVECDD